MSTNLFVTGWRYQPLLRGLCMSLLLSGCAQTPTQVYCPHSLEVAVISHASHQSHDYFQALPPSGCFSPLAVKRFQFVTDAWRYREQVVWQNGQAMSYSFRSTGGGYEKSWR